MRWDKGSCSYMSHGKHAREPRLCLHPGLPTHGSSARRWGGRRPCSNSLLPFPPSLHYYRVWSPAASTEKAVFSIVVSTTGTELSNVDLNMMLGFAAVVDFFSVYLFGASFSSCLYKAPYLFGGCISNGFLWEASNPVDAPSVLWTCHSEQWEVWCARSTSCALWTCAGIWVGVGLLLQGLLILLCCFKH